MWFRALLATWAVYRSNESRRLRWSSCRCMERCSDVALHAVQTHPVLPGYPQRSKVHRVPGWTWAPAVAANKQMQRARETSIVWHVWSWPGSALDRRQDLKIWMDIQCTSLLTKLAAGWSAASSSPFEKQNIIRLDQGSTSYFFFSYHLLSFLLQAIMYM